MALHSRALYSHWTPLRNISMKVSIIYGVLAMFIIKTNLGDTRYILEIKEINLLEDYLRIVERSDVQLNYQHCKVQILQKLKSWRRELKLNELFFENPITNYLLIKLFRFDLKFLLSKHQPALPPPLKASIPSKEARWKAANLLNELMDTYGLSPEELTAKYEDKERGIEFSKSDCLVIVQDMLNEGLVDKAEAWNDIANQRNEIGDCTKELFNFDDRINALKEEKSDESKYNELCKRTETVVNKDSFINGSLSCKVSFDVGNPFLIRKAEMLSVDPLVELYHDAITTGEVRELVMTSNQYQFEQAQEVDQETGYSQEGNYRVAEDITLPDEELMAKKMNSRITMMTGLKIGAEALQIVKYRPGGVYPLHHDFFETEEELRELHNNIGYFGNRLATAMIFLNKPELGGNLVLPQLDIGVVPHVGDLVVFHSVDKLGNHDRRSLHAGCKVFMGNKVATLNFIYQLDQGIQSSAGN